MMENLVTQDTVFAFCGVALIWITAFANSLLPGCRQRVADKIESVAMPAIRDAFSMETKGRTRILAFAGNVRDITETLYLVIASGLVFVEKTMGLSLHALQSERTEPQISQRCGRQRRWKKTRMSEQQSSLLGSAQSESVVYPNVNRLSVRHFSDQRTKGPQNQSKRNHGTRIPSGFCVEGASG